jgi:predicted methyltransferase
MKIIKTAQYEKKDKENFADRVLYYSGNTGKGKIYYNLLNLAPIIRSGEELDKETAENALREIQQIITNKIKNFNRYSNEEIVELKGIFSKILGMINHEKPVYASGN